MSTQTLVCESQRYANGFLRQSFLRLPLFRCSEENEILRIFPSRDLNTSITAHVLSSSLHPSFSSRECVNVCILFHKRPTPSSLLHFQRHEPFHSAIVETIIKLCRVSLRAAKVSCLRNLILNLRVDLRNERVPSLEFVSNSLYRTGTLRVSWISNDPVKRSTFKTWHNCLFIRVFLRFTSITILEYSNKLYIILSCIYLHERLIKSIESLLLFLFFFFFFY